MYSAQPLVGQPGLEIRFARAARHSRLVRALRISIPALVAAALAAVVLISLFNPFRVVAHIPVDLENLVVSGTKITMESPRLAGFSADNRPYEVWAKSAVQDTTDPDNLTLTEPRGKILMEDLSTVNVESRTGHFNNKAQRLDLYREVFLQTSNGNELRLNHAQIDIAAGAVATDDGVDVTFEGGKVKADRLRLTNRGEVVRFDGNVVMEIDRAPSPTPQAPVAEPVRPKARIRPANSERAGAK